ncbi:MAG: DUF362 domain-containing protein [Deltaproteobacteria bacterium]|nr:DUF362 domain-containing protein [Deltaproteobacteria bacterium]
MIRVGLVHTKPTYQGLTPPFAPGRHYPEFAQFTSAASAAAEFNHVFAAVRTALRTLELDGEHYGEPGWNPLGEFVSPGAVIVLKPNFIRHWNPLEDRGESVESVITHGAVLRAMVDYALLAAGPQGRVIVAEAPQQDCDFDRIRSLAGLDELVAHAASLGRKLEVIDLRREAVVFDHGIIVERKPLPGDPAGYRAVDLGRASFFEGSGLEPERFRGADYDPGPTSEHHRDGRNEYLLSETVLCSDLIVNLPKLKTHKKTGVTLALKNLVGINGDKKPGLGVCRGRRVSAGALGRQAAQPRHRDRPSPARPRPGNGVLPRRAPSRNRHPGRRIHSRWQLARQQNHLAHVLRPQSLPVLQRSRRVVARRARTREDRAHADRRRGGGRRRRAPRPGRRAPGCDCGRN